LNPRTALEKALFELCQIRPGETVEFKRNSGSRLQNYSDVRNLRDHSAFLMSHDRKSELAFLLDSGRKQRIEELPDGASGDTKKDLETAVEGLIRAGSRVAYADLTTPDIEPFGIRVVRTIATGLQPINFGHGEERLGAQRLFELPRILKYADKTRTEADLNPCPHPLA
jgi:ribosomal protein S12 methylthiotransferase accessory factor